MMSELSISSRRGRAGEAPPSGIEPNELIGQSPIIREIREKISAFAPSDATVLIQGETGVGKELVSRAIHQASERRDRPFIAFNCCALPETLAEKELFGNVRGAFTGADCNRDGLIDVAGEGILLLDEVGDLPMSIQGKLLRFIEERRFCPVGSCQSKLSRARILASTNVDLKEAVKKGTFRRDLFYRLYVLHIDVPPIRQRPEDIPLLAKHLLNRLHRANPVSPEEFTSDAMDRMFEYSWPGNVREMDNVITRAALQTHDRVIRAELISLAEKDQHRKGLRLCPEEVRRQPYRTLKAALLSGFDRCYLDYLLKAANGYVTRAAKMGGIDKKHLIGKMKQHNLSYRAYRAG